MSTGASYPSPEASKRPVQATTLVRSRSRPQTHRCGAALGIISPFRKFNRSGNPPRASISSFRHETSCPDIDLREALSCWPGLISFFFSLGGSILFSFPPCVFVLRVLQLAHLLCCRLDLQSFERLVQARLFLPLS